MKVHLNNSGKCSAWMVFILLLASFLLFSESSYAQREDSDTPSIRERMFYGGGLGLQFGTVTDIEVSPLVGIWLRPRWAVAAGPEYTYYKDPANSTSIYGVTTYIQFVFIKDFNSVIPIGLHYGFYLHAENDLLNLESAYWKDTPYTSQRFFTDIPLAGIGISQPVGRKSSINLTVLWPLSESEYVVYSNPELKLSFIF